MLNDDNLDLEVFHVTVTQKSNWCPSIVISASFFVSLMVFNSIFDQANPSKRIPLFKSHSDETCVNQGKGSLQHF